ncbi:UNVERIFIED_CONTAM: hypothetical protein GTU68_064903 [Idotea baltica]|nr:hypothetical protein [Idotea baltica]
MSENAKPNFTRLLLEWNETQNHRPLPWKGIKNPYFIWLSEIILQQTRVEQGKPYYLKFTEKYPTVIHLANAPEDEVMKMWEGLGYYSRARNLHAAAKYVADELNGVFPTTYDEIKKLKGVGDYTAAAIASFAYNLPHAVVDGNVYRVLSRYFGIETPIDSTEGKKQFAQLAQELLHTKQANTYNQAIMDFGARHCTPAKPLCLFCNMQAKCVAFQTGNTAKLPIKNKKIKKRTRYFYYLVIEHNKEILVAKRTEKDIWQDLYEFFLIEETKQLSDVALKKKVGETISTDFTIETISEEYKQLLTHQKILSKFVYLKINDTKGLHFQESFNFVSKQILKTLAFPKSLNNFINGESQIFEITQQAKQ